MSEEDDVRSNEVVVEVYMAMQHAPVVYDFFVSRSGSIRSNPLADPMDGLIQVVMAGMHPTPNQQRTLADHFGADERYRLLKFY